MGGASDEHLDINSVGRCDGGRSGEGGGRGGSGDARAAAVAGVVLSRDGRLSVVSQSEDLGS